MATVSIDKDILENLCNFKLKWIAEEINRILAKWNARSIEQFIEDVKEGNIPEGEDDAIDLTNLRDQREELYGIKQSWGTQ